MIAHDSPQKIEEGIKIPKKLQKDRRQEKSPAVFGFFQLLQKQLNKERKKDRHGRQEKGNDGTSGYNHHQFV
jgi:hypothetical protein